MHKTPSLLGAVRNGDIDGVRRLLTEGANPRLGDGRELPLHVAAQRGPLELVEVLIAGGALEWQPDAAGRRALEMAQIGNASDKAAIVALLDCDAIADASFRAAVAALHAGDVAELARLIDAEPRLLHERMMGPEAYRLRQRPGYFRDPKLIELLIERGARTDLRDTLWDATPLEWAMHGERSAAIAALERLG